MKGELQKLMLATTSWAQELASTGARGELLLRLPDSCDWTPVGSDERLHIDLEITVNVKINRTVSKSNK